MPNGFPKWSYQYIHIPAIYGSSSSLNGKFTIAVFLILSLTVGLSSYLRVLIFLITNVHNFDTY